MMGYVLRTCSGVRQRLIRMPTPRSVYSARWLNTLFHGDVLIARIHHVFLTSPPRFSSLYTSSFCTLCSSNFNSLHVHELRLRQHQSSLFSFLICISTSFHLVMFMFIFLLALGSLVSPQHSFGFRLSLSFLKINKLKLYLRT